MIGVLNQTNQIYKQYLNQDSIVIKNHHFKLGQKHIKPAVTVDIQQHLNNLFKERRDLYIEYKLLQDKILFGANPSTFRKQFEDVHQNIYAIQKHIDDVYDYYDAITEPKPDPNQPLKDQVENLYNSLEASTIPQYIKQFKKLKTKEKQYEEPYVPDYVVLEAPSIVNAPAPAPTKPKTKINKNSPKQTLDNINAQVIKNKIKDLIKQKLKPKNFEECASQKRSQPYFMKKEDILETISNNPELEKTMPPNYKSMSKENLCKILFP